MHLTADNLHSELLFALAYDELSTMSANVLEWQI